MFELSIKTSNLFKSELKSAAKKRTISDYKSMSKNEVINAINLSKTTKNNKKSIFKSKRKEPHETLKEEDP